MDPVIRPREIWPPGTIIKGDYEIEKRLGKGGFGTVYLARHRFLQSHHVIKRLHEEYASDDSFVKKFMREGQAIRRLRGCPHIVEVEHMTQTEDGHLILVMEYLAGGDLDVLIKTSGHLSVPQSIDFAVQIAEGLKAAHAMGLIHRDIKPQNVLLARRSDGGFLAKVIDFGIAADHQGGHSTSMFMQGSLGYAAPEQWTMAGKNLDGRADLYALGATLYRMLTGRMPYEAEDVIPWLAQVQTPPASPGGMRSGVPVELDRLVLDLLSASRDSRPPDADTVITRLRNIGKPAPHPAYVPPVQTAPEPPQPLSPAQPRRTWVWLALAGAVLAVFIAWRVGSQFSPSNGGPDPAYTLVPSQAPSPIPTPVPTPAPTVAPTLPPTPSPTRAPTMSPTPVPTLVDHIAPGDAARDRGDFRTALNHYRQSADSRKPQRLEQLQRAIEGDVEERVATLSDSGQLGQAETLVNGWIAEFPHSQRLQRQKALVQRRRESQ